MVKISLNKKQKAVIATAIIVVTAVILFWSFRPGDPYLTVSDVVDHSAKYEGKSVDVKGTVEEGTLNHDSREFNLTDGKESLRVISDVQLPDNLKDGKDCVVKGRLVIKDDGELEFQASEITVGCPSKYE